MKRFLPRDENLTRTNPISHNDPQKKNVLAFGIYFDEETLKWRFAVEAGVSVFLIQNAFAVPGDPLYPDAIRIMSDKSSGLGNAVDLQNVFVLDQYGGINYANSDVGANLYPSCESTPCGGFVDKDGQIEVYSNDFFLTQAYIGKHIRFNTPCSVFLNTDILSADFYCYFSKNFSLTKNEIVTLLLSENTVLRTGNLGDTVFFQRDCRPKVWGSVYFSPDFPVLVSGETIKLTYLGIGSEKDGSNLMLVSGGLVQNFPFTEEQ